MVIQPKRQLSAGKMSVMVYETSDDMGKAAAYDCAKTAIELLHKQDEVNIIFAPAVSQVDFYRHFFDQPGVDWTRMNAFILIEYLGMPEGYHDFRSNFARENIFSKAPFKNTFAPNGCATDFQAECDRYAKLLKEHPIDIACLGIGENGHVAANEPWNADFNDIVDVKYVEIESLPEPRYMTTVTMSFITRIRYKQMVVPGNIKKEAIFKTIYSPISEDCPSTVMRNYDSRLYTDMEGAASLGQ